MESADIAQRRLLYDRIRAVCDLLKLGCKGHKELDNNVLYDTTFNFWTNHLQKEDR